DLQRDASQLRQQLGVFVRLVKGAVSAQLRLDFVISGESVANRCPESPRRLSLGESIVVYAVFRHEARGGSGNAGPDAGLASALACHGTGWMIVLPRAVPIALVA